MFPELSSWKWLKSLQKAEFSWKMLKVVNIARKQLTVQITAEKSTKYKLAEYLKKAEMRLKKLMLAKKEAEWSYKSKDKLKKQNLNKRCKGQQLFWRTDEGRKDSSINFQQKWPIKLKILKNINCTNTNSHSQNVLKEIYDLLK